MSTEGQAKDDGALCGADVGALGFTCNGPVGHDEPHAWKSLGWKKNVYRRFIEELDGMTIAANTPAVIVIDRLTRAVARAQLVVDGELPVLAERVDRSGY